MNVNKIKSAGINKVNVFSIFTAKPPQSPLYKNGIYVRSKPKENPVVKLMMYRLGFKSAAKGRNKQ